jgi:hypothetical protein
VNQKLPLHSTAGGLFSVIISVARQKLESPSAAARSSDFVTLEGLDHIEYALHTEERTAMIDAQLVAGRDG